MHFRSQIFFFLGGGGGVGLSGILVGLGTLLGLDRFWLTSLGWKTFGKDFFFVLCFDIVENNGLF